MHLCFSITKNIHEMYKNIHIIVCKVKTDQRISVNNILGIKFCLAMNC